MNTPVRRFLIATTTSVLMLCVPDAYGWTPFITRSCPFIHWDFDTGVDIRLRFDGDGPLSFTSAEKTVISTAAALYNQLPHARIHILADGTSCSYSTSPQPDDVICIRKKTAAEEPHFGDMVLGGEADCHIDRCKIRIRNDIAAVDENLYIVVAHELAHCLGVNHSRNSKDWMAGGSLPPGGSNFHIGITRDTENAVSFLHPFGRNFLFADWDRTSGESSSSANLADIATRYNGNESNTVPWSVTGWYTGSSWSDKGVQDTDFGNETTIAYLAGDFTGDGLPDIATGLCSSCDPGDGDGDSVSWYVNEGAGTVGWGWTSRWTTDFGNGEDYDQYRSGDLNGDGCDDLWLIRNYSEVECDPGSDKCRTCDPGDPDDGDKCKVKVYVKYAVDNTGPELCDAFGSMVSFVFDVSDRSAANAWPWVIGDFDRDGSSAGCADLAFGVASQSNPLDVDWWVATAVDSNSDGDCDSLQSPTQWANNLGDIGQTIWFSGAFSGSSADDLVRVKVYTNGAAEWYVAESNGSNAFSGSGTKVSDMRVTGSEVHWTGKVFGVGDFNGTGYDDFVALTDEGGSSSPLEATIAMNSGGSTWSVGSTNELPSSGVDWQIPTDWDDQTPVVRDNGGDDAKETWWCPTCDYWFNDYTGQ
jgi:hypothetical protein